MTYSNSFHKTLIHNARVVVPGGEFDGGVLIVDGRIADIFHSPVSEARIEAEMCSGADCVDFGGDLLMAGVIDTHVHFREPGLTHKGDIASESRAAVAGGVTSFLEMPNTKPLTVTQEAWEWKMKRAAETSAANYGFFMGATADNLSWITQCDFSLIPGIKLFLSSSTGNMLVEEDSLLAQLFANAAAKGCIVAVHAEDEATIRSNTEAVKKYFADGGEGKDAPADSPALADGPGPEWHARIRSREACLLSTQRAVKMAQLFGTRLHVLHISTLAELEWLRANGVRAHDVFGPDYSPARITTETCPHYLRFPNGHFNFNDSPLPGTEDDRERGFMRYKCNPAVKDGENLPLLQAVREGRVDVLATDHAPHLIEEKCGNVFTAASGMPGIQFSLPVVLSLEGFTPAMATSLMSANPAKIYAIEGRGEIKEGFYADLVRVHRHSEARTITAQNIASPCAWTPYEGITTPFEVVSTWVNGRLAYTAGQWTAASALPLKFAHQTEA